MSVIDKFNTTSIGGKQPKRVNLIRKPLVEISNIGAVEETISRLKRKNELLQEQRTTAESLFIQEKTEAGRLRKRHTEGLSVIEYLRETETVKVKELQRENNELVEKLRVVMEELDEKTEIERKLRAEFANEKRELLAQLASLSSTSSEKVVTTAPTKVKETKKDGQEQHEILKRRRSSDIGSAFGLVFGVPTF